MKNYNELNNDELFRLNQYLEGLREGVTDFSDMKNCVLLTNRVLYGRDTAKTFTYKHLDELSTDELVKLDYLCVDISMYPDEDNFAEICKTVSEIN